MFAISHGFFLPVFAVLFLLFPTSLVQQKKPKEEKSVPRGLAGFYGGIFLETDGNAPGDVCFRLSGRMTGSGFFDNLKRIDDLRGTHYVRGTETITKFPEQVRLEFFIRDRPCSLELEQTGKQMYLTRSVMSSMHLYLYWKRGLELRPVENATVVHTSVAPIVPYAAELAGQLPERYEWLYEMTVPSAGVPLTDDLVLILRNPDGKIAARVAARL